MLFIIRQHVRGEKLEFASDLKDSLQSFFLILPQAFEYSHIKFLQQMFIKVNLCPSPTIKVYLHHRTCQRSCSTAPRFSVLHTAV